MTIRHRVAHILGKNKKRWSFLREVALQPGKTFSLPRNEELRGRHWDAAQQVWWVEVGEIVCVGCQENVVAAFILEGRR